MILAIAACYFSFSKPNGLGQFDYIVGVIPKDGEPNIALQVKKYEPEKCSDIFGVSSSVLVDISDKKYRCDTYTPDEYEIFQRGKKYTSTGWFGIPLRNDLVKLRCADAQDGAMIEMVVR